MQVKLSFPLCLEAPVTQARQSSRASTLAVAKGRFRRDVALAVAIKFTLLLTLYLVWFSPAHRARVTSDLTATALMGQEAAEIQP